MSQFQREIETLKGSIDALSTNTDNAAKAQSQMAKSFGDFYAGGGHSPQASREFDRSSPAGLVDAYGRPISSQDQEDGASRPPGVTDKDTKSWLHRKFSTDPRDPRNNVDLPDVDPRPGGASGGASRPPGSNEGELPYGALEEMAPPLKIPQFGEFKADEMLRQLGGAFQRGAEKRPDTKVGDAQGRAAVGLYKAANFAPKAAIIKQQMGALGYSADSKGLEAIGTAAGASGTGGQVDLGVTGFTIPYVNSQAWEGVKQQTNAWWKGFSTPGVNSQQVEKIYSNMNALGFHGGDKTNRMRDVLIQATRSNKNVADNPIYAQITAESMRYDSSKKTADQLIKTFAEDVPKAMKNAQMSAEDMAQAMVDFGNISRSQGGSFSQGAQDAGFFGTMGINANQASKTVGESPFYQTAARMQTGLPSWQQGLMSSGGKYSAYMGGINMVAQMAGGKQSDSVVKSQGWAGESGGTEVISGLDKQAANMVMIDPTLTPEQAKAMLDPKTGQVRQGLIDLGQISSNATSWSTQLGVAANNRNKGKTNYSAIFDTTGKDVDPNTTSWGEQISHLKDAEMIDPKTGKPVRLGGRYPKSLEKIENYGSEEVAQIMKNGVHGKEVGRLRRIGTERQKKLKDFMSDKDNGLADAQSGDVVVELGPAAKKHFHIAGTQNGYRKFVNKQDANGGQNTNTNDAYTGPTDNASAQ